MWEALSIFPLYRWEGQGGSVPRWGPQPGGGSARPYPLGLPTSQRPSLRLLASQRGEQCCRQIRALARAPGHTLLQKRSSQPLPCPLLPQSYTPTVFERLTVNLQIKGKPLNLQIWDTAGGCAGCRTDEGGGAPHAQKPSPAPFVPNQRSPASLTNLQGRVLATIRVPRNLKLLCSCTYVRCLPQQRVASYVPETRGSS